MKTQISVWLIATMILGTPLAPLTVRAESVVHDPPTYPHCDNPSLHSLRQTMKNRYDILLDRLTQNQATELLEKAIETCSNCSRRQKRQAQRLAEAEADYDQKASHAELSSMARAGTIGGLLGTAVFVTFMELGWFEGLFKNGMQRGTGSLWRTFRSINRSLSLPNRRRVAVALKNVVGSAPQTRPIRFVLWLTAGVVASLELSYLGHHLEREEEEAQEQFLQEREAARSLADGKISKQLDAILYTAGQKRFGESSANSDRQRLWKLLSPIRNENVSPFSTVENEFQTQTQNLEDAYQLTVSFNEIDGPEDLPAEIKAIFGNQTRQMKTLKMLAALKSEYSKRAHIQREIDSTRVLATALNTLCSQVPSTTSTEVIDDVLDHPPFTNEETRESVN